MRFQGALVQEQGVRFGIVVVKPHILHNPQARMQMLNFGVRAFGISPVVLMAQNAHGTPTYWGRKDLVDFLAKVPMQCIPWKNYSMS